MDEDQVDLEAADVRAEKAKASLRSRLGELERRFEQTKDKLDLGARIANHPRAAVGIALGIGALLGMLGGSRRRPSAGVELTGGDSARTLGGTVIAALGAFALQALKDAALHEGSEIAKTWWADRTERVNSNDPAIENFFEH